MDHAWISLPSVPPLLSTSAPILFLVDQASRIREEFLSSGARVAHIDLSAIGTNADFFDQLRKVLVFPSWCGSGWDSVDDAFEEIRAESSFPCVVLFRGIQDLLRRNIHLGLEIVIRISELQGAFSIAGEQFIIAYQVE